MHLPIIDRNDYGIAALATVQGWGISYLAAIWLALPIWMQTIMQTLLTLVIGLGILTAQHFWRRHLHQRWPIKEEEEREKEDA